MKGRFQFKSFMQVQGVPDEIRHLIRQDPREAFIASEISAGRKPDLPDDLAVMQVFVGAAHLHSIKDEDIGIHVRFWEIVGYIRPPTGRIGRLVCQSRYRSGDSKDAVESDFERMIADYVQEVFEGGG